MDNPTEIQIASDQTADSDVEFLSAESSRVEDGETPYQDSLAVTEGSTTANGDVNLNQSKKEDTGSNGVESNEPVPNGDQTDKSSGEASLPSEITKPVTIQTRRTSRKGPPALLPLQHGLMSNGETRALRQAALKSANKIKAIAKLATSESMDYDEQEITVIEAAQGTSDADVADVHVQRIADPSLDVCQHCHKIDCLKFKSTGQHSKKELKFCNMQCVRAFFKYSTLHCTHGNFDEEEDEKSSNNHIIVEPDIEIHTLGDEFQMETDEADTSVSSNGPMNASHFEDIDKALKDSLICSACKKCLAGQGDHLQWEAMDFCSDNCLKSYVKAVGWHCNQCSAQVNDQNLGKLCVRFGTVIRQFCTSECLEKFKSKHKLCTQCQVNMTDKDKVYCSSACQDLSRRLTNKAQYLGQRDCAVCTVRKTIKFEIFMGRQSYWICSKPCRNAFRFANKMTTLSCSICARYFDVKTTPRYLARCSGNNAANDVMWLCSSTCFATHLYRRRKIELCSRCQVKKYNVDMIRKPGKTASETDTYFCSLFCYNYNQLSVAAKRRHEGAAAKSAASQASTSALVQPVAQPAPQSAPTALSTIPTANASAQMASLTTSAAKSMIIINNVTPQQPTSAPAVSTAIQTAPTTGAFLPIEVQHKIISLPPKPKEMKNKAVWCRPAETVIKTGPVAKSIATETNAAEEKDAASDAASKKMIYIPIPIPVPIYVPVPLAMYSIPAPFPVGFPVPYPTPVILPIDANDAQAIVSALEESEADEILREEREAERSVAEPFEVGPLEDSAGTEPLEDDSLATLQMESSMVEPMLDEVDEESPPANENPEAQASDGVDETSREAVKETTQETTEVPANEVTEEATQAATHETIEEEKGEAKPEEPQAQGESEQKKEDFFVSGKDLEKLIPSYSLQKSRNTSRKRSYSATNAQPPSKRLKADSERCASDSDDPPAEPKKEQLKQEFGMKAWSAWLGLKKRPKQTSGNDQDSPKINETNENLIEFLRSLRKPDLSQYRPDTLLYLFYGIATKFDMGKEIMNIFIDTALTPFQEELDKHLKPFYEKVVRVIKGEDQSVLLTCLTEPHLWDCRQLGSHSPLVLVFTMLYFNTKYFRLYKVEDHEALTFANVEKVPMKNSGDTNGPKTFSRAFCLQYNSRKGGHSSNLTGLNENGLKIRQNHESPSQCPVRLYNFYLSKCPESAKTGQDAFYLMPLENQTPDSLWYSSQPVPREILARMLHRAMLIEDVLLNLCFPKSVP